MQTTDDNFLIKARTILVDDKDDLPLCIPLRRDLFSNYFLVYQFHHFSSLISSATYESRLCYEHDVCPSVTLVDCGRTVQQKAGMVSWLPACRTADLYRKVSK